MKVSIFAFLFTALMVLMSPFEAFARIDATLIKEEVYTLLDSLERNGINAIDGQSIDSIRSRLDQLKIDVVPFLSGPASAPGSYRATGRWSSISNSLVFSDYHMSQIKPDHRPLIGLHEVSGPLGIDDDNFNKTGAASLYLEFKSEIERNPRLLKNPDVLASLKHNIESRTGGSTGVEGGGDARLLSYMSLIQSEMSFDLNDGLISLETYKALSAWVNRLHLEFSSAIRQGELAYLKESHTLIIPDNANTDHYYRVNLTRLRQFLKDIRESELQ